MKQRSNLNICVRLLSLVKPLTGHMLLAITLGVIGHLAATFITIIGGAALLNLLGFETPFSLKIMLTLLVVFAILRGVLHYGEQAFNHYIAFSLLALIRDKVFRSLRKLCPAKLEGKEKGNLISIITSDIELLEVFYAHTISPIVIAFLTSLIMTIFIGHFHPSLGVLAALAYLTIGVIIPSIASKLTAKAGIVFRSKSGQLSSFVLDSLRGLPEILQYNVGKKRLQEMNARTDELSKEEERIKKSIGINSALTQAVILLFDITILVLGFHLYIFNQVDFVGLLIPIIALMSSFGPVIALANLGSTLTNTFAAGNRVLNILDDTPVVEELSGNPEINFLGAKAEHVSFAYDGETILSDVTLDIPENKVLGIVGKSGSGKSTFLKLLMRFWDTNKGKILISDTDIKNINTSNLRNMESFVTQETHLFHDSIKNNLLVAKPNATDEEIEAACKKASVHDFILKLPNGYDTPVGELGDTLSGGERQRLGLARAFLHDAPFLLLDEPTSNLDSLNEAVILKSIYEERKDKTVVLVSHRESTMKIADQIYRIKSERKS